MASAPTLCQAHGSLLLSGADTGLLLSSRESLSSRKSVSISSPLCSNGTSRARSARQHLLLVTARDDSLRKQGTGFFKFGGKKESSEAAEAPASGTRLFKFGGKKQAAEETSEAPAAGTGFFKFGGKKQAAEETAEAPAFGTGFFKFGGKKQAAEDEESKSGTKIFRFGTKKESSGTAKLKAASVVPKVEVPSFLFGRRQDPNTVFVAGATGQIGARVSQKLLRDGFNVRGGVRDLFVAQQLAEFATQYGLITREEARRINAVEFDFRTVESIAKAISNASKVVVTIGPAEDGPKSKVSFSDASNVIEAAKLANIGHLVVVYEPGTAPTGEGPLAGLTSFFSELFSKPAALSLSEVVSEIVDSQLSYTVLKISPTEGVDDFSSEPQSIDLRNDGAPIENYRISKAQVASVVATVFSNTAVAENKVVAVTTSPSVAKSSVMELLSAIPTDGRRAALAAAQAKAEEEEREREAREQVEIEARAAQEEALKATQLATKLEAEADKVEAAEARAASFAEKAQAQAAAAAASVDGLASKVKELGTDLFKTTKGGLSSLSFSPPTISLPPQKSTAKPKPKPKPTSPPPKRKQREPVPPTPVASAPSQKPQIKPIFGGLFQQETVYVDEV